VSILKKHVVKPMSILSSEITDRNYFPCVLGSSYIALRIYIQSVVETPEGKWDSRRIVEKRRGTLPGVGQAMGNERL